MVDFRLREVLAERDVAAQEKVPVVVEIVLRRRQRRAERIVHIAKIAVGLWGRIPRQEMAVDLRQRRIHGRIVQGQAAGVDVIREHLEIALCVATVREVIIQILRAKARVIEGDGGKHSEPLRRKLVEIGTDLARAGAKQRLRQVDEALVGRPNGVDGVDAVEHRRLVLRQVGRRQLEIQPNRAGQWHVGAIELKIQPRWAAAVIADHDGYIIVLAGNEREGSEIRNCIINRAGATVLGQAIEDGALGVGRDRRIIIRSYQAGDGHDRTDGNVGQL